MTALDGVTANADAISFGTSHPCHFCLLPNAWAQRTQSGHGKLHFSNRVRILSQAGNTWLEIDPLVNRSDVRVGLAI